MHKPLSIYTVVIFKDQGEVGYVFEQETIKQAYILVSSDYMASTLLG